MNPVPSVLLRFCHSDALTTRLDLIHNSHSATVDLRRHSDNNIILIDDDINKVSCTGVPDPQHFDTDCSFVNLKGH